jgi:uncharacterized protein (TIGR02611 family)
MTEAPADAPPKRRFRRIRAFRGWVRGLPGGRLVWRIVVTVLGVAIIAIGILLLPLPGPGWLIIFAGLGVLATEYTWANRLLVWARRQVARWGQWLTHAPIWVRVLCGLLSLALLGAIALAAWYIAHGGNL